MKRIIIFFGLTLFIAAGCDIFPAQTKFQEPNSATQQNSKASFNFHCKDLLSDSDFQNISGHDPQSYRTEEGSDNFNYFPLTCAWKRGELDQPLSFAVRESNLAIWPGEKAQSIKEGGRDLTSFGIDGFGSGTSVTSLSGNKKYYLSLFVTDGQGTLEDDFNLAVQFTKVVDKNLDKY